MDRFVKQLLLFAAGCCLCLQTGAQNARKITGEVRDTDGMTVIGAVIRQKDNVSNAAVTDKDGAFKLIVPEGKVLEVICMGYATQDFKVTASKSSYSIVLDLDAEEMEELVVIGYGTQKKSDLTGSVGVTDMSDLKKAPVSSVDQALAGRIAGVQISSSDDQPGNNMDIVIRGGNSLTQSNAPLYVVDGFPMTDFNPSSLNPQEIQSISILKDASATAIYGSRGANGVVIIDTMTGREGRTNVSYEGYVGIATPSKTMELMDPVEFLEYQLEINPTYINNFYFKDGMTLEDYRSVEAIDWQNMVFRQALIHNNSISISGGNKKTTFSANGSYTSHDGVVINSGYSRFRGRVYLNHKINESVRFNVAADYSRELATGDIASQSTNTTQQYSSFLMFRTWGARPVVGVDQEDLTEVLYDSDAMDTRFNPYLDMKNSQRRKTGDYIRLNGNLLINILPELELQIKGGWYSRVWRETGFYNSQTSKGSSLLASNTKGVNGSVNFREARNFLNENTLKYHKKIQKRHDITVLAGFTLQGDDQDRWEFGGENVLIEQLGISGIDNGTPGAITANLTGNRMMSFLSRVNYNFLDRYLFTATFRADGSSKFAKDNRWGYFPSAAFAYHVSNENFFKPVKHVLSDMKIRLSYGETGNDRVTDFARFSSLTSQYGNYYSFGNQTPSAGIIAGSMGNDGLKWETTAQFDAGVDMVFFKDRINLTIDYYDKETRDLLLYANVPYQSGYSRIYKNVGRISNAGMEFSLSTINFKSRFFSWTTDFNISFNQNVVRALNEGETRLLTPVSNDWTMSTVNLYMAQVGGSNAQFIGLVWDGVYNYDDFNLVGGSYVLKDEVPANGMSRSTIKPGDVKYKDIDGDGTITDKDIVVIGSALPKHFGGLNNDFVLGNLSLNVFFQWCYGNDIMNANRMYLEGNITSRPLLNQFKSYVDRWTPDNPSSTLFRAGGSGSTGYYSSRTLEDGSFIRLKTVQLSYNLPGRLCKAVRAQRISCYVSGQNLYTWSHYSGMDPEVSVRNTALTPGFDYSAYPRSRTFVLGLKATF